MRAVGNNQFQKAANMLLVLNYLRENKSCSRQKIAEELGLQPSSVSYIVGRLIKEGLVEEYSDRNRETKSLGRRPIMIRILGDYGYVIGLDLQVDYYCVAVYDIAGTPVLMKKVESPLDEGDFFKRFTHAVEEIRRELKSDIPILGLGLAIPGIVDSGESHVVSSWTHKLADVSLKGFLGDSFPFPVVIDNDANCCALNILWNNPKRDPDSFIYLLPRFHRRELLPDNLPSVGIGMGLVINGKLFSGYTHEAGEYQSILFSRERRMKWQLSLPEEDMDRASYDKDIQREIITELMENMFLILQVLNPRSLIIGGDFSGTGDLIIRVVSEVFPEKWGLLKKKKLSLEVRDEGVFDSAKGAAACILEKIYAIPQVGQVSVGSFRNNLLEKLMEEND